jgi:glycine cleavage system aminomethyltransferase T
VAEPPPKQRQIWFESCLQTAFLPAQQFWEAFVAPEPPQMLPGGLQAWPFVQVRSSLVLVSYCVAPGLVPFESQKTP